MKYSKEIKIGLIFLGTLVLFIWGFNFLKGKNLLKNPNLYYAVYDNVQGLNDASPIMINGLPVGNVNKISLMEDKRLLVAFSINNDIQIPLKSQAVLFDRDIMGSKGIDIILYDTLALHTKKDTLIGTFQNGLSEKVAAIEIEPLLSRINNTFDSVQLILSDVMSSSNRDALSNTLTQLDQTTHSLASIMQSKEDEIASIIQNLDDISTTLNNNSESMQNILTNFSALSDSLQTASIKSTIDTLNQLLAGIQQGKGTIGQAFQNDSLYLHLDSTVISLNKLLQDVEANPKKYVHFSLFGKGN